MTKKIILLLSVIALVQIAYGFKFVFGTEFLWLGVYVMSIEAILFVAFFAASSNTSSQSFAQN